MVCYRGGVSSASLLLHPVRLRIIKAFIGGAQLTTSQLASRLPDIPQATMYRHVARLAAAGVLEVVTERRVRGAVERTYELRPAQARLSPREAAAMSLEEHSQAFLAFTAGLLADFDRYLAGQPKRGQDGATYQIAGMWLTDAELGAFAREIVAASAPRIANQPAPGRRRQLLYTILLPADEAGPAEGNRSPI
jgi:DNA-binding transcriptional ArsR family regulator